MTEASAQTKECPYCGETIKKKAQICIHCDRFLYTGRWQRFRWTGLRGKGLWDILSLIIMPLALVLISIWFSIFQANRQVEVEATRVEVQSTVEADHAQEAALQAYFDHLTELLLEEKLRESDPGSEVRSIARARTLTVLPRLGPERKGMLLKFLYESKLIIMGTAVIDLSEADLRKANLNWANLSKADLRGAGLWEADLRGAGLWEADLSWADLSFADLTGTNLQGATLIEASLTGTDLTKANLSLANLSRADLIGTYLTGAILIKADLRGAELREVNMRWTDLRGAELREVNMRWTDLTEANLQGARFDVHTTLPDGTAWTPDTDMARFTDPEHPDFWHPDA